MGSNEKLCRMCTEIIIEGAISIYKTDSDNLQYISMFKQLFPDVLLEEDENTLPKYICEKCCFKMKDAYSFKKQCVFSIAYLKKCVTNCPEDTPEKDEQTVLKEQKKAGTKLRRSARKLPELYPNIQLPNTLHDHGLNPFVSLNYEDSDFVTDKLECVIKEETEEEGQFAITKEPNEKYTTAESGSTTDSDSFMLPSSATNFGLFSGYENEKVNEASMLNLCENFGINPFASQSVNRSDLYKSSAVKSASSCTRTVPSEEEQEVYVCFVCQKLFGSQADVKTHISFVHNLTQNQTEKNFHRAMPFASGNGIKVEELDINDEEEVECIDQENNSATGAVKAIEKLNDTEKMVEEETQPTELLDKEKVNKTPANDEKPYSCEECHKRFSKRDYLNLHRRCVHRDGKRYNCTECPKQFRRKSNLLQHMIVHKGEKPYSCKQCQKEFSRKYHLARHMITHKDVKPYSCTVCRKEFSEKKALKTHAYVHTGVKPFTCNMCGKQFTSTWYLNIHLKNHDGELPYECSECPEKFAAKMYLTRHMRIHLLEQENETA